MTRQEITDELRLANNLLARTVNALTGNSREVIDRLTSGEMSKEERDNFSEMHQEGGAGKLTRMEFDAFKEVYSRLASVHNALLGETAEIS